MNDVEALVLAYRADSQALALDASRIRRYARIRRGNR